MRKSTFYGLAAFCGVGSLFFAYVSIFTSRTSCHPPVSRVEGDFSSIGSALRMYAVNNGQPPTTGQGISALVDKPVAGPKPKRWSRVMDCLPVDPWQTPYRYTHLPPKMLEWRYELRSAGEDRIFGSRDDIIAEDEWGKEVVPQALEAEAGVEPRPSY